MITRCTQASLRSGLCVVYPKYPRPFHPPEGLDAVVRADLGLLLPSLAVNAFLLGCAEHQWCVRALGGESGKL